MHLPWGSEPRRPGPGVCEAQRLASEWKPTKLAWRRWRGLSAPRFQAKRPGSHGYASICERLVTSSRGWNETLKKVFTLHTEIVKCL